ncbi:MAG: hypothetical protein Q7S27_07540 [Nanoarchaeota archaeon]|nr:hypothetical protein [Nanoarchaeota archaeon]
MMKENKHDEIIVREQDGFLIIEVKMSKELDRKMSKLVIETAGTIPAI